MKLKEKVLKMFCFVSMMFMFLTYISICKAGYNGIVVDSKLINTIRNNIDYKALNLLYGKSGLYVDFGKIYATVEYDDMCKMSYVIPILDCSKKKVIGEIASGLVVHKNGEDVNALSFITSNGEDRDIVSVCLKERVANFFRFGGVSCSKYIPSIFKNQKLPKPITKKVENTAYHYLPLKDKLD